MSLLSPRPDNEPVKPRAQALAPDIVPVQEYPSLNGLRVLVVDDEFDARHMVGMALELHGAKVVMVPSADDALDSLRSLPFDVLVSDISMPGEDGYHLMRKVRSRYRELPALALTAYDTPEDYEKAKEAGFTLHIAKPIEAVFLVAAVADLAEMVQRKKQKDDY